MTFKSIITTMLIVISITDQAQINTAPDSLTKAYLKKFRLDFVKAVTTNKPEIINDYCGDDIRLMTETQKTMIGKSNALLYYKSLLQRFAVTQSTRQEFEILDLGMRVIESGLFTEKLKLKSTGKEYELNGKYLNIWEQKPDGTLLLITEAWNYNHRVEIADQLIFPEVPTVNVAMQSHLPVKDNITFELAALNALQEKVITEHDAKLWSQFYADDYILFRVGNSLYKGRKEIDSFLEAHVKELPVFEKLDIRNDRVDNLGEYVIEYASHIAIVRNGDWSGVATGKDIRIWRREKNGTLKIIRGIGAYD
ncbi:MAG: nuclear transport factor 2 family protein [Ferruginibacter sp.]